MIKAERDKINADDRLVYFGQGLVFGVFEVIALIESEFNGWEKKYPFQVKIKPLAIQNNPIIKGLIARPLQSKIGLAKMEGKSSNLLQLTKEEFEKIETAIKERKELIF